MNGYRIRHGYEVVEVRAPKPEPASEPAKPFDLFDAYPVPPEGIVSQPVRAEAMKRRGRALAAIADIRKGAEATGEARARKSIAAEPAEPTAQAGAPDTPPAVIVASQEHPRPVGDREAWRRADYADHPWQATVATWRERGWHT